MGIFGGPSAFDALTMIAAGQHSFIVVYMTYMTCVFSTTHISNIGMESCTAIEYVGTLHKAISAECRFGGNSVIHVCNV